MSRLKELSRRCAVVAALIALLLGWGAAWGAKDDEVSAAGGADYDFGDAPEGVIAYPDKGVVGMFPTCVGVGPASWIQHASRGAMYFGAKVDLEADGNGGHCPTFSPNQYNMDETISTAGDAGLTKPRAYTITGPAGSQAVTPLSTIGLQSLGNACTIAMWGTNIDIRVHNTSSEGKVAYVNVLFDWNHDGVWAGSTRCSGVDVPEHTVVNFPVPYGYSGLLSGLSPSSFKIGPVDGYVWVRFSITDVPVAKDWNGDGVFNDGETEDYLLYVQEALTFCTWDTEDPHAMHWAQLPNKQTTGIAVDLSNTRLADDFQATQDGPLMEIHFWASFLADVIPQTGVNCQMIEINIYSNAVADKVIPWSRPDKLLWTRQVSAYLYDFSEMGSAWQAWYEPNTGVYESADHERGWQYSICLDEEEGELFEMRLGTIYWLELRVKPGNLSDTKFAFGWKTTRQYLQFEDNAVFYDPDLGWQPLVYPEPHTWYREPLDLAFVVVSTTQEDMDFGDAPDPTYPTWLSSNGARHVISPDVYLGRGVDGEQDGQPNATATGDDVVDTDDEDGVVFLTDLIPGQAATLQVTASTTGALSAWIDWNADGDWDDADEQVATDVALVSGTNTLVITVPGRAEAGETFARFRFSTTRGLEHYGLAPDGEVEDYRVWIVKGFSALPPTEHLTWSQPPIETDPGLDTPVFCGWDQASYVSKLSQYSTGTWYVPADDFRCIGDMPVTSVHWWGSYEGWNGDEAPSVKPASWRIAFWSNAPADSRYNYSRPDSLLWVVSVTNDRVEQEWAGFNEFPEKSIDTSFRYSLALTSSEYFDQNRYVESTRDDVFWISITAVYTGSPGPTYPWGWQTRPQVWEDAAIAATFRTDDLRRGLVLDSATTQPITSSLLCDESAAYDLAFELDTDPTYIKWEQAFTDLRDWPYYEDEQSLGTGSNTVSSRRTVADDWRCTSAQAVTAIVWWGSYVGYDYSPSACQQRTSPQPPDYFLLSLWSDVPSTDKGNSKGYGYPNRKVWEYKADSYDEVLVGFDRDSSSISSSVEGYEPVYRYTVRLPADSWYRQDGTYNVLWLSVQAVYASSKSIVYPWGWTNHAYATWDLQSLSPVGYWKLDESSGVTAADSSGNGNHGTLHGDPVWRTSGGWFDGALDFDGRGDYIQVDRPAGFNFAPDSFSVSAWIYPRETTGQYRAILEYDRDSAYGNRFGLWLDADGRVHFRVGLNTWQSQTALRAGQWYHVAGTFEADTKKMSIYVDGLLDAAATNKAGFVTPTQATLVIGARGAADDEYFNGLIDDVRVYASLLTSEEVLILAGTGRNEGAVYTTASSTSAAASWMQLLDPTGQIEDMSFVLFGEPLASLPVKGDTEDDKDDRAGGTTAETEEKK
ncbi:MAG TPA: LamG domain-containing protein [Sedimentisphaerales bacterium]|jgi:hypothetical protein|nr:LamG domain-containing protein [Sedimentisphaerales bacterium]HNU28040.1 LamG domain-containing protein [Sedimentisphaerales bacterium]